MTLKVTYVCKFTYRVLQNLQRNRSISEEKNPWGFQIGREFELQSSHLLGNRLRIDGGDPDLKCKLLVRAFLLREPHSSRHMHLK